VRVAKRIVRVARLRRGWASGAATLALAVSATSPSGAGEADVVAGRVRCDTESVCRIEVTVRHADVGWKHYADRWDVLDATGQVLATRVLSHPHVHEQPFTRTLTGVALPAELARVRLRAHDSVHDLGGAELEVEVERGRPVPDEE